MTKRLICIQLFVFMISLFACKSNSTSPDRPDGTGPPTISLSCSPTSGGTSTVVSVTISIKNNQNEIKSFGSEISFNTAMFKLQSVSGGSLTGGWATVDGNEIVSGTVRVGAFAGSGPSIQKGSNGTRAIVKFEVTCSSCSSGQQSQFCFTNLFDDIVGMEQDPSCVSFTFTK
jgi:hypothetical protein